MSEANIAASRRVIEEAFGEGRLEILEEICAADFVDHDPIQGERGLDGVKETIRGYRDAFPDLSVTVDDIFTSGDKVVIRWSAQGTFENEFLGQPPTHEEGDPIQGIGIDRFDEDGKLAEAWAQWDVLTFMRQLGLLPAPAEAPAGA
jgi:steroid delta-isomerase-like uncharacterized protein